MWLLSVLSALMAFASISTDLYLPAMPAMQADLHASGGAVEWTVSGYLIGFSLGQLLWGPVGDRFGRRIPISLGLVLFVIGSAGCALADSATGLIAWRAVQAAGACASVVLARAMVRDLYEGEHATRMMSTLITVMAIAPLLGPSAGGLVLQVGSWRGIFWVLVALGLAVLAALWTVPETLPPHRRNPAPLHRALGRYATLVRTPQVLGYVAVGSFFYGGVYAYIAGTPFAFISYHHVDPRHYGMLFALGISGIMITNLLNAGWVSRFGGDRLMRFGAVVAAVAGIIACATAGTGWGGLMGLAVPLFVFVSASGLIVANSITGALAAFPEYAGSVSALVGACQYGTGIVSSALVGAWADGTPAPMAYVMAACGLGSALSAVLLVRSRATAHMASLPILNSTASHSS